MSAAAASLRLFFALWPDAAALAVLQRTAESVASQRGGRAPRESNLHVTVAFLGSVESERLPVLTSVGATCSRRAEPFVLSLDRIGGTANGIAWLAPAIVPRALAALHEDLLVQLGDAGFATERRRFRPHVTLARHCSLPPSRQAVDRVSWHVDRLSLVASTPAPGGSRYAEAATWPLGAEG